MPATCLASRSLTVNQELGFSFLGHQSSHQSGRGSRGVAAAPGGMGGNVRHLTRESPVHQGLRSNFRPDTNLDIL